MKDRYQNKEYPVPLYNYYCKDHGEFDVAKSMNDCKREECCPECGRVATKLFNFAISGTRDNFGIKNAFVSDKGEVIDNWKSWEKAGYRQAKDCNLKRNLKEQIGEKKDKLKGKIQVGGK